MTQIYDEQGRVVPVTLVEAGPCYILQDKTNDKDGYEAFQVGFQKIEKKSKIKKSMKGKEYRYVKECRIEGGKEKGEIKIGDEINKFVSIGDEIKVDVFQEGDKVKISGVSKGKGFQGAVKRWGFKGKLSATHGTKHEHRTLGSVGMSFPERVIKGRKMPGHTGAERVTVKNLKIAKIDLDNNLIAIKGAVPGHKGTLLEIRG